MKEDNISQLGDYDVPFYEQQYTRGSWYISFSNFKSFDQFNTPKLLEVLDIYSVVALYFQIINIKQREATVRCLKTRGKCSCKKLFCTERKESLSVYLIKLPCN